jgi:methionine-rich copper-binding protein CopC
MRHLLVAALLLVPAVASAHAILQESQPAAQSTVAPGTRDVVLRFNSRIDKERSRLTLQGTHAEMTLPLLPDSPADTLAARADLTPGQYTLR